MSGGGSYLSDQKVAQIDSTSQLYLGPCRVTSIQAAGVSGSILVLYDNTSAAGTPVATFKFGAEGFQLDIPGSGIRFQTGVWAVMTNTTSLSVTYN